MVSKEFVGMEKKAAVGVQNSSRKLNFKIMITVNK